MLNSRRGAALALILALAGCTPEARPFDDETALDRYVRKPDPTYAWKVLSETRGEGVTQFIVDLKSQTWRTEKEVSSPLWQHWVTVVSPDQPASSTALLWIGGGANGGEP